MELEWLSFVSLIYEQLSYLARAVRWFPSASRPQIRDQDLKSLEAALAIGARNRKELITLVGRTLPLEVSLDIFKLSGFVVASEWTAHFPDCQLELEQAAFKYLAKVSMSRQRDLSTVSKALQLAERYVKSLEDPVEQAEACATLFLAAGSKVLGPRLLAFVENLQLDPQRVFLSLVARTGFPNSFLRLGGDVLIDIRASTAALIKIGLDRLAYPLIALSEAQFGYALYSALFNEVVFYTVAANGRPEFCPKGRAKAEICQKFIRNAKGRVFEGNREKKVAEIGDALLFVWNGDDHPEEWAKISAIVDQVCGLALPASSLPDTIKRIAGSDPDYIYILLSMSWKCGQSFNPNNLQATHWHRSIYEALARLSADRERLLVHHELIFSDLSPAYKQALLDIFKRFTTQDMVRPLITLMFSPVLDSETLYFLIDALKMRMEDCAMEAGRIVESLYESPQSVFQRFTVDQFNLIVRISKVSSIRDTDYNTLGLAISRRILFELDGDLLDHEDARLAFNGALRLSNLAVRITLQVIKDSPHLTCSPRIWKLVDRLPSVSEDIKSLHHS